MTEKERRQTSPSGAGTPGRPGGTGQNRPGRGGPGRPGGPQHRGFGPGPALGRPVEKPKNFRQTFFRLLRYFRPYTGRLLLVLGSAILATVFTILSPRILGRATTDIFNGIAAKLKGTPGAGVPFMSILHILEILAVLYVFSAIFNFVQQYIMAGVAQSMIYELRKEVNEKLSRLPLRFYDTRPHGEIQSRFVNDFDNIGNTLQQSLTQFITSIVTFVGVVVMMLTISPWLTLVVALTLPLSFIVTMGVAKRSQRFFIKRQASLGELNGHVEEMYTGHRIVKAYGGEDESIAAFNQMNDELYESWWKSQFISGIIMPMMNFIGNLGFVFVSVVGAIFVTRGAITIGEVQAFIQYARQFSQPITQLASISNIIQSTIASAERVFELLDEEEEIPEVVEEARASDELGTANSVAAASPGDDPSQAAGGAVQGADRKGEVVFHHVSFSYDEQKPVIQDLNLHVEPGQTIAIVGPTGAGKTTLVNLLMRFYDVQNGQITIDDVDITQMERGKLRSLFGMVLQDTWLFRGTLRENIAYGRENASEDEIVEAAMTAHADHFIRTLPDGYETIVNEEASNISQGQRQLLTIARAVLANPTILILDEATSSVDTRTEVQIQEAMARLRQGRTSFVIAHRLSTIRDADVILVMNHGRIVEQGSHEGLMAQNGFYADLYNSQFAGGEV